MKAALPANEQERLEALYSYAILDTLAEGAYDDITEVATQIAGSPIGLVSLVDANRQWFKSKVGLAASETPRELAFCAHAILTPDEPLIVPDATRDPRFADNQLVLGDPAIRFYMGAPLVTPDGKALGTLCVIDRVPRQMTQAQVSALMALSRQVVAQLELRRHAMELRKAYAERELYLQQLESYQEKLELANAVYQEKSLTDRLTGLRNRAALDERLAEEIDRAARYKSPLSLLLLDVDRFKVYNDTHGHIAGDDLLRLLAAELRGSVRPGDFLARYGGEEFCVLLPSTGSEGAHVMAQRVRKTIASTNFPGGPVTISVGTSTLEATHLSGAELIHSADLALYAAKQAGRNCVRGAATGVLEVA